MTLEYIFLGNIIKGKTVGNLSDETPILIVPDSYAFSIWSLIYVLMGLFVLYIQLTNCIDSMNKVLIFEKINWWFVASNVFKI